METFCFSNLLKSNMFGELRESLIWTSAGLLGSEAAEQEKMDNQWHIKNQASSWDFGESDPYIKKYRRH